MQVRAHYQAGLLIEQCAPFEFRHGRPLALTGVRQLRAAAALATQHRLRSGSRYCEWGFTTLYGHSKVERPNVGYLKATVVRTSGLIHARTTGIRLYESPPANPTHAHPFRPQPFPMRRSINRIDDILVTRTPTQIPADATSYFIGARQRISPQQLRRRDKHAACAKPTLKPILGNKSLLQSFDTFQAFNRPYVVIRYRRREHKAGLPYFAIKQHRACTAVTRKAPDTRALRIHDVTNHLNKQHS